MQQWLVENINIIMYTYILCEFTYGQTGQFYQEVDVQGIVIRMTDLDGNTLHPEGAYGAVVVDANPTRPSWAPVEPIPSE